MSQDEPGEIEGCRDLGMLADFLLEVVFLL